MIVTEALDVRLLLRQAIDLLAKKSAHGQFGKDTEIMLAQRCIEDPQFIELAERKLAEWRNQ